MNQVKNLKALENLSYFDKNTLSQVVNVSDKSLSENTQRWIKNDKIIPIKNGLYVTRTYLDNSYNKVQYAEFIANKLRTPSYLSMEYVLQKHSVLTESVFSYTSITLKTKRIYKNTLGTFIYRSVKPELFAGYNIKKLSDYDILEASKEKALFDYLYLKLFRINMVNKELIDSFRLNTDEFTKQEKNIFEGYCSITDIKKYKSLPSMLF